MGNVARSSRRSLTRADIVDAAIAVIDRDGPRPSMDDVAHEAGIAKPRLYRLVADKADLYNGVAARMTRDFYATFGADLTFMTSPPREAVRRVVTSSAATIREHPNVFRFLGQAQFTIDAAHAGMQLDIGRDFATTLALQARPLLLALRVDDSGLDYLVRAIVGLVVTTADLWLGADGTPDDERTAEFIEQVSEFVWQLIDGFLRRKGVVADPDTPLVTTLAAVAR